MPLASLYHCHGTLIMQDKDSHKQYSMFVVKRYETQGPVMQVKGTGPPQSIFDLDTIWAQKGHNHMHCHPHI